MARYVQAAAQDPRWQLIAIPLGVATMVVTHFVVPPDPVS